MKKNNSLSKLLAFSAICSTLVASGCGLREAKKQQRIREAEAAAKRSAELSQEFNESLANKAAQEARRDLDKRVRYVRALEGEFEGSYSSTNASGTTILAGHVEVIIYAQNMPVPFVDDRPSTAGETIAAMEAISLTVEIVEESLTSPDLRMFCSQTGVKPDYERGLVRVSCTNMLNSPAREYLLALDDAELDQTLSILEDTVSTRGMLTSLALIEGRKDRVSEMNLRIASPFGKIFRLRIGRQGAPERPNEGN